MVSTVGLIAAFVLSTSRPDQFRRAKCKAITQDRRKCLYQSTACTGNDQTNPVSNRKLHLCRLSRLVLHDSYNGSQPRIEIDDKSNVDWLAERYGLPAKWKAKSTTKALNKCTRVGDRIEWIQEYLSLTEKDVAKMIRIFPPILMYDPARNVQPTTDFLQRRLQLSDRELSRFIVSRPSILSRVLGSPSRCSAA